MVNEPLGIRGEVCAVLETVDRPFGGGSKIHKSKCSWWRTERAKDCDCGRIRVAKFKNDVSNAAGGGADYYAGLGAAEAPTAMDEMAVFTAVTTAFGTTAADADDGTTIPTDGRQAIDGTYPQTNDSDANNPSAGSLSDRIITWRSTFATGEGNGSLVGVAIARTTTTYGSTSGDGILMSADVTITKTSSQSLIIYVNHTFSG